MYNCEFWIKNDDSKEMEHFLFNVKMYKKPSVGDKFPIFEMIEGLFIVEEVVEEIKYLGEGVAELVMTVSGKLELGYEK